MAYYLGGPMRGYPKFNFPAFFEAADLLRKSGLKIVSPAEHDIELGFDDWETAEVFAVPGYSIGDAIGFDLDFIASQDCQGIILLPGWEESSGAQLELHLANFLNSGGEIRDIFQFHLNPSKVTGYSLERVTFDGTPEITIAENREEWPELEEAFRTGEVRTRNADTGGEKGQKQARFDLIPVGPLWELARLYGKGAEKYAERNWELGYDWNLSYAALQRHINLFWSGEDNDPEMGLSHLACAAFHCFAMMEFVHTHPELDNRPKIG